MFELIAFTGYGGAGKDEAAKPLIEAGYSRGCFGDIIKGQVDPLIRKYFGFSAFTEDRAQKTRIRRTLESWGEDNYDSIFKSFFDTLPAKCVNTRLCRLREAEEWVTRGGIVVEIRRPGVIPETEWAQTQMTALRQANVIHDVIENDGTLADLSAKVLSLIGNNK